MNLNSVFISVLTLFIMGIIGYFCRKKEILGLDSLSSLPKFLLDICVPSMIIASMQIPYTQDKIQEIKTMLIITTLCYTLAIVFSIIIPRILRIHKEDEKGVYQFMTIFSNVGFMGFPVLASIYGDRAIFYASIMNLPFNLLVFTVGVYLMQKNTKISFKSLISPSLIATLLGLVLFSFSIPLPDIIKNPIILLGDLTTPLSMIYIGALLTEVRIIETLTKPKLYAVSFIRLILFPVLVLLILRNFAIDPLLIGVAVIISGMPVAANCAIIASQYGGNTKLASEGIFLSTLLSIITIPLMVYMLSFVS